MITPEQVLTLFGGWARAQIPQPIEIGVDKPSVTVSPSTYISSNDIDEVWCKEAREEKYSEPMSITIWKTDSTIEVEKAWYDFTYKQEKMIPLELTTKKTIHHSRDGSVYETRSRWDDTLFMTWGHLAFTRFFEIWERGTLDHMMNGLLGTKVLQRSFSGLLGSHNGSTKEREKNPLDRNAKGEWFLKENAVIDRYARLLPKEGIASAQQHARDLRRQRLAKKATH